MAFELLQGKRVRTPPPGRLEVRLNPEHRRLYRLLYARFRTVTGDLPVLREDRDFDGRAVRMTKPQLSALNKALAEEDARGRQAADEPDSVFESQAEGRSRLFKRLQYLS
jgi:hypothetical protein